MKSVVLLLASAACLWAAAGPAALDEANAGLRLAREGKYELAIARYRAAIALDPDLPGIYLHAGIYLALVLFMVVTLHFRQLSR